MKFVPRVIHERFMKRLLPGKVLILLGSRRTGKTVFIKKVIENLKEPYLLLNGEDVDAADQLRKRSVENYKRLLGNRKVLIIDEAQKIEDIGMKLKLMADEIKGIKIIATGSSVFDLTYRLGEPLTGRSSTFYIYPLAQMELAKTENAIQTHARLEERLIYGSYPELTSKKSAEEKVEYLKEIVSSYLLKDLLVFDNVRNSSKLFDLLRLIAFQIGKEVSYHELANQLGISKNTVERYLDLLSKVFVIYKLQGFSRNLRKEIT
ncbi:MAG TPA: AAA family ATPase, partial [Bacteroidia bacterium]|nr:AAA family ATPase [Bacteroidia bacterium]